MAKPSRSNILLPRIRILTSTFIFNGMYPYIDPGTGGNITGMIAAVEKILSLADNRFIAADSKTILAGFAPRQTCCK